MRTGILALALASATPVFAESSLGIAGADLTLGVLQDEAGRTQTVGRATVDVAITTAHGLQGDISFEDTSQGLIGRLNGHLYMDPVAGQKYGLFLAMSDLDGQSLNWLDFGAEGQLELGEGLLVSGRAGLGRADDGVLDYIFGGAALAYEVTPAIEIEATLDLSEFDEAAFRATSVEVGLTASYSPVGQPWGLYGRVAHSDLMGREGTKGATRLGLGITFAFGNSGGVATETRPFRDHDAVAALVRRGLR